MKELENPHLRSLELPEDEERLSPQPASEVAAGGVIDSGVAAGVDASEIKHHLDESSHLARKAS